MWKTRVYISGQRVGAADDDVAAAHHAADCPPAVPSPRWSHPASAPSVSAACASVVL